MSARRSDGAPGEPRPVAQGLDSARLAGALNEIDAAIGSSLGSAEIMQRALEAAVAALAVDGGTIELRESGGWVIRYQVGFRTQDVGSHMTDAQSPVASEAARRLSPISVPDVAADEGFNVGFVRNLRLRSVLAVPMVVKDAVVGCLIFYCTPDPRAFGCEEIDFAARLGASVSLAFENARLFEAEMHEARTAETLSKVNEILLSALTVDDVIGRLVGEASEAAGADKSLVIRVDGDRYVITHVRRVRSGLVGKARESSFFPTFALAAVERRPILVGDAWADPGTNKDFVIPNGLRALQLLPLVVDGAVTHVLALAYETPQSFDEDDYRSAERMAAAMSMAMKNARLYESEVAATRLASEELKTTALLLDGATILAEASSLEAGLSNLVSTMRETIPGIRTVVYGVDAALSEFQVLASGGGSVPVAATRFPLSRMSPAARSVFETRKSAVIDLDALPGAERGVGGADGSHLMQAVPLVFQDRSVGMIVVDDPAQPRRVFSVREVAILEAFAAQVAAAVENKRLLAAERDRVARLTTLQNLSALVTSSLDMDAVVAKGLEQLVTLLGVVATSLWIFDEDQKRLHLRGGRGFGDTFFGEFADGLPLDADAEVVKAFNARKPIVHEDATGSGVAASVRDAYARHDIPLGSLVTVPLRSPSGLIGGLTLAWDAPRAFTDGDRAFYVLLADTFAIALENARLFQSERDQLVRLESHTRLLEGLNTVLDRSLRLESEEELGEACLAIAEGVTGSPFGFLGEVGEDGTFSDVVISNPGWDVCRIYDRVGHRRAAGESRVRGIYSRVLSSGKSLYTNTPESHSDAIGVPEGHPPITAFLGVPLLSGDRVFGMVAVANRPGGYRDEDQRLLEALAPAMMEGLERKRAERLLSGAVQRLDAHINNSPLAVIEFDSEFRVTRWSDEAERIFGWTAEEVLGKAIGEFRWVYDDDTGTVDEESSRLFSGVGRSVNVNRNYRKDGSVIWCEWYDSAIYDANGILISTLSQVLDITQRRTAEEALRESEQRYRLLFANMLDGFAYCRVIFNDDGQADDFVYLDVNSRFEELTGLQEVIGRRVTEVIPGIREANPGLLEIYGGVARTGKPARFETEIKSLGLSLSISLYRPAEGYFVAIFDNITEAKRAEAERLERERLGTALSAIGAVISATLVADEILERLLEPSARALRVDTAGLSVKQGDRWEIAAAYGSHGEGSARAYTDHELAMTILTSAAHQPMVIGDVRRDPRVDAERTEALGIRSTMAVPIVLQNNVIGVMVFNDGIENAFSSVQVDFATRLMGVVTLALENARLYERERRIADTLQDAVLSPPKQIEGLEVSWLYRPASSVSAVGGDFYDVFEIEPGSVGVVVGDVSGKGLEAARTTSLLRDGIRAYAYESPDPTRVLDRVNCLVNRSTEVSTFATVFFGLLDLASGKLSYAVGGHPPGMVLRAGGDRSAVLPIGKSALVGAFPQAVFETMEARLDPGDVLLLYTDGVTEARREGELFGQPRLLKALKAIGAGDLHGLPGALLEKVLDFTGGSLQDDTVVLALRRSSAT
jgi:PAS domain S-box-containing protein